MAHKQRAWDKAAIDNAVTILMANCRDGRDRARLLAVRAPHSSDWLHALPISACGLRLDDDTIRISGRTETGRRHMRTSYMPMRHFRRFARNAWPILQIKRRSPITSWPDQRFGLEVTFPRKYSIDQRTQRADYLRWKTSGRVNLGPME